MFSTRVAILLVALAGLFPRWANAWPLHFGLKGGLPVNGLVEDARVGTPPATSQFSIDASNGKFIFGPTVELMLPARLSVEFDMLYRSFSADLLRTGAGILAEDSGQAWEFPLVAKYRLTKGLVAPFVSGGLAFRHLSGLRKIDDALNGGAGTGFCLGAGLEGKLIVLRLSPEIRYTRWAANELQTRNGTTISSRNQVEFFIGVTF